MPRHANIPIDVCIFYLHIIITASDDDCDYRHCYRYNFITFLSSYIFEHSM